jgi:hypothetical protein
LEFLLYNNTILKKGGITKYRKWESPSQLEEEIKAWIVRYNTDFPHSSSNYKTPEQFAEFSDVFCSECKIQEAMRPVMKRLDKEAANICPSFRRLLERKQKWRQTIQTES